MVRPSYLYMTAWFETENSSVTVSGAAPGLASRVQLHITALHNSVKSWTVSSIEISQLNIV